MFDAARAYPEVLGLTCRILRHFVSAEAQIGGWTIEFTKLRPYSDQYFYWNYVLQIHAGYKLWDYGFPAIFMGLTSIAPLDETAAATLFEVIIETGNHPTEGTFTPVEEPFMRVLFDTVHRFPANAKLRKSVLSLLAHGATDSFIKALTVNIQSESAAESAFDLLEALPNSEDKINKAVHLVMQTIDRYPNNDGIVNVCQALLLKVANKLHSGKLLGMLEDTRLFKRPSIVRMVLCILAKFKTADSELVGRGPAIVMTAIQNYSNDTKIQELGNAVLLLMQKGRSSNEAVDKEKQGRLMESIQELDALREWE